MRQAVNAKLSTGKSGEAMAIAALGFLAAEESRLERFLALSGLGPHNLRQAAADPGFLAAVLDYVAADERLLVAFAASRGLDPAADRARQREPRRSAAVVRPLSAGEAPASRARFCRDCLVEFGVVRDDAAPLPALRLAARPERAPTPTT